MQFDLVIVGGGLTGLALACALRDTRLSIALVDSGSPPARPVGWDARIYAITPANAAFLRRIGAWKHLDAERIAPIHAMAVEGDDGARLDFSAYAAGLDELGWIVESSLMACELWENAKRQSNLRVFHASTPRSLTLGMEAASLELSTGETLHARLVAGADGRDSWVREAAGITAITTPYDELGVVANFACAQSHRHIAHQWFRDDGVLAWLPLPGQRISMVWSTPEPHASELLALSPEALCAKVAAAGHHALGRLEPLTAAAAFPLSLLRVAQPVGPRIVLLGDAAHGIHPLSGHGVNLGFQDAAVLAAALAETPAWQDVGHARLLNRYARARKEETWLMQSVTHALHRLFRETLPGVKALRNAGMSLTNRLPFAKDLLIRYAVGAL